MTRRVEEATDAHVMESLSENGLDGTADALSILMKEAMKLERSWLRQAGAFERTEGRRGYANGYKDKTIRSGLEELGLRSPQVREADDGETFYPQALERGLHGGRVVVRDDHEGLKKALRAFLPSALWQRCQFHLPQNAGHHVPRVPMRLSSDTHPYALKRHPDSRTLLLVN